MRRITLDADRLNAVGTREVDLQGSVCNLEVETGPDGWIYFTNQNGIYRIVGN